MLTHPTCDRLEAIGLTGMAQALHEQRRAGAMFESLSFEERLGLLVDREAAERDAKRLATWLRFAALRHAACVEDVDMRSPRGIDAGVMAHLIDGGWIKREEREIEPREHARMDDAERDPQPDHQCHCGYSAIMGFPRQALGKREFSV